MRRIYFIVGAAIALVAWWWLRPTPQLPSVSETAAPAASPADAPARVVAVDTRPAVQPEPRVSAPVPATPIIDAVSVEKTQVCDGEENLITVKAHTPDHAQDAFLHAVVGGELGMQVPLRMFRHDTSEGEPPPLVVRVFGMNNVTTEAPVPPVEVLACKPKRRLHIVTRSLPNAVDEIELVAKIIDVEATKPMQPVEARWDFGDGTQQTSTGPLVTHDYSARKQDTLVSQLLIRCEVRGADGETLVGRAALQLSNAAFEHLAYRHRVLLYTKMNPRFPVADEDGVVRQKAHVWHRHATPVTITAVQRRAHFIQGSAEDSGGEVLDPMALFGTRTIGPEGVDAEVSLDTKSKLFSYELIVEGKSDDGLEASGAFSVMRPPERPTRENSQAVVDPLLKAKILRARQMLKQAFVTDEDLHRLGAQGAFDDISTAARNESPQYEVTPGGLRR